MQTPNNRCSCDRSARTLGDTPTGGSPVVNTQQYTPTHQTRSTPVTSSQGSSQYSNAQIPYLSPYGSTSHIRRTPALRNTFQFQASPSFRTPGGRSAFSPHDHPLELGAECLLTTVVTPGMFRPPNSTTKASTEV